MNKLRPAIFLDRDGVLNRWEKGNTGTDADYYILGWDQFEFLPRVMEALFQLYCSDYEVFVISNQSGISKNLQHKSKEVTRLSIRQLFDTMCMEIAERIRSRILCNASLPGEPHPKLPDSRMSNFAGPLDIHIPRVIRDFMFCPHLPEHNCACRKPKPGMIYSLAVKWGIDLSRSWMIGDQDSDIEAGINAGIPRLVHIIGDTPLKSYGTTPGYFVEVKRDLLSAVEYIQNC